MSSGVFGKRRHQQRHRATLRKTRMWPSYSRYKIGRVIGATRRGAFMAELVRGLPVRQYRRARRAWWLVAMVDPHYRYPREKPLPWTFFARRVLRPPLHCRYCMCADDYACDTGCSWYATDPPVCSNCIDAHLHEQLISDAIADAL